MFHLTSLILPVLWLASAVIDYSELCYIWQLKEYRWDRVRDFFSTRQGKRHWLWRILAIRIAVILTVLFWPWSGESAASLFTRIILIWSLFLLDIFFAIYRWRQGKFHRPAITIKAMGLMLVSLLAEIFFILSYLQPFFFTLFFRSVFISCTAGLLYIPTKFFKEFLCYRATQKIKNYPALTIIGITGSYGKTSTKDFLAHILSGTFRVLKTPANQNNDIGISRFILNNDLSKADILVIEMGAYRVGDIEYYCNMTHPKIGILTAINEQHLSLFGSMENTQQTKYALLRSLPKDGLAVTNSDNAYCREFLGELTAGVETFGKDESFHPACRILTAESGRGTYTVGTESLQIDISFPGKQYLENIAPCILVAKHLGLTNDEIVKQCKTLPPPLQSRIIPYGTSIIIDNSYNSNPAGFEASLDLLNEVGKGRKKIVITRGMLELGAKSDALHERIGKKIGEIADELVVITPDFVEPLRRGVGEKKTKVTEMFDHFKLRDFLKSKESETTAILIENRIPESAKAYVTH